MDDKRLTPRKMQILKAIVDAHIAGGEPVGSKYLSQEVNISCSPATIRNEMAELEAMGYLLQPHTSAGRVPSELGYRYYVDALVRQYANTRSEIDEINETLRYKLTEMDEILAEVSRLASSFTDYTGIAFKPGSGKVRIVQFKSVYLSQRDFLLVMTFENDAHLAATGLESNAGVVGEGGCQARNFGQDLIHLGELVSECFVDLVNFRASVGVLTHKGVYIISVAKLGGNSSR